MAAASLTTNVSMGTKLILVVQASTSTFYPFTLEVDSNINALTVTAQISAQLQIRAPLRISAPPKAQNL